VITVHGYRTPYLFFRSLRASIINGCKLVKFYVKEREGKREETRHFAYRPPQPTLQTLLVGPDNLSRSHAAFRRRTSGRKAPQTAG